MSSFNPNSSDAMFAQILTEIREIKGTLGEVRDETRKTNGRVTALERDKWYQRGVVATIGVGVTAAWEIIRR